MAQLKKLSELCLDCIVDNFENFMSAYYSGSDIPRKYFEFLQRTYSDVLLDRLIDHNDFEEYIEFLLNPYLKTVHLDRNFIDITMIIKRLKEIGPTITSLYFTCPECPESVLMELLSFLPNVEILVLNTMNISEDVLKSMRNNCQILQTLDLNCCMNITDKCIEALCFSDIDNANELLNKNCPLKHLYIMDSDVTSVGIACALKNLRNLLSIQHMCVFDALYKLHIEDLKNNAISNLQAYNLEELTISDLSRYPNESLEMCSLLCPNLKKLMIAGITSQSQINTLSKFLKLKVVYIALNSTSVNLIPFIEARGGNLEVLDIQWGKLSVDALLKFCPKLQALNISYCEFLPIKDSTITSTNFSFQYLKKLSFQSLNLTKDMDTKSVKHLLLCSPELETLNFNNMDAMTNAFVQSIVTYHCMNNLLNIDVDGSDITFFGVKKLMQSTPNLKSISVQECNLTDLEIGELEVMRPFVEVLYNTYFSDFSDPNDENDIDDFEFERDHDYFDYDSESSYNYYDYEIDYDDDNDYTP